MGQSCLRRGALTLCIAPEVGGGGWGFTGLAAGLFAPSVLMPLNRLVGSLARRLGIIVNYVLLGFFLYAVVSPIGLLMRLAGRDPMRRRFDPDSDSYLSPVGRGTTGETLRDMF